MNKKACLDIFGLTINMINRRTKEIGIRKVLGAGIYRVMYLIMKEYMILVALANVVAWPLVWIIMQKILQNFPYRISIGIKYFFLSGVISIAVAMGTVLFLVIKAAAVNPVECLRHE
jgi:putative ABC transport system permease protein